MANDGVGAPLSRRVPGETRPGPGQSATPVLPESVLSRMQAAIDAEHAQAEVEHAHAEVRQPGDPNTEPLPRVTASGPAGKRGAKRPLSPSGVVPELELPEQAAKPARPPKTEEPLRVAKALRAVDPEALLAIEPESLPAEPVARRAVEPAAPTAAEPEPPPLAQRVPEPPPSADPPPLAASAYQVGWVPPAAAPPTAASGYPVGSAFPAGQPAPATPGYPGESGDPPNTAVPPRVSPRTGPPKAGAALESGLAPASIGWLWPEETAAAPGGGGPRQRQPRRWRYRTATLAALAAVVLAGAGVIIGISVHSGPAAPAAHGSASPGFATPTHGASLPPALRAPRLTFNGMSAVAWVKGQVTSRAVVACDIPTCAALAARGFPVDHLVRLSANSQSLSGATVAVVTPVLHTFFTRHPSLGNEVVSGVLARFGTITVQVIYPGGAAAYQAALDKEMQARIHVGEQLLAGGVSGSPAVQRELRAGDVDPRVLLVLEALAAREPIEIVAFQDSGPGAGPGIPYRIADVATSDPAAGARPGYVQAIVQVLKAHATFPAFRRIQPIPLPDGQRVAQIKYSAPSPFGLLSS
jgi:hypothetical protein